MARIVWDAAAARHYETGIDQGVLYPIDSGGAYPLGVPWNGLISVTESPSGAEPTPVYADNIKYLTLLSLEEFGLTIEAYTYPEEFEECDGSKEHATALGVVVGQQPRKQFGLCYRTKLGNDVDGESHGYKLHLVYGCLASPSEKGYASINDSPEAITFSWAVTSTPVVCTGFQPTCVIIIDSTRVNAGKLATFLDTIYGSAVLTPSLPLPDAVITALTP